jgi:hypothetical protein
MAIIAVDSAYSIAAVPSCAERRLDVIGEFRRAPHSECIEG